MSAERWARVEEIFLGAVELPTERRRDYLRRACGDDAALRREVEEMLEADAGGEDLLSASLEEVVDSLAAPEPAPAPRRIGPYSVLRLLGRGGMGAVYLGEREDVGLRCALKVVRGGAAGPGEVQRFLFERRLLARLQHPHIARLLDAGVEGDGTPWFAMELVEGEPIDRYCDARRLSTEERLGLFEHVCEAVAYAHRNLIVHRDLKPSNILVSAAGEPKLLDFGIAKLLADDGEELTGTGMRLLTPGYAAPEQVAGEPVTTATDVYALGLVLYELLCGRGALGIDRRTPSGVDRWLQGSLPLRPSSAVLRGGEGSPEEVAAARGTIPAQLRRRLSGDLDAIVMRALAREPERRYGSAAALLEDVRRHRRGLPVSARPETWSYRARTLVRRNRAAVAAGALGVSMLAAFAVAMTVQQAATARERDRAEAALARATRVSDFLVELFDVADPFSPEAVRADSITVRDFLVQRGERVTRLEREPEVQLEVMNVVGRMYLSLGMHERAQRMFEQSLALGQRLYPAGSPDRVRAQASLAELQAETGEHEESERNYREALALARRVHPTPHRNTVSALHGLGNLLRQGGRYAESEALLRESLALRRELYGARSAQASDGLNNLGLVLWAKGELEAAAPLLEEAVAIQRVTLPAKHPTTSAALNNLGLVRLRQGDLPAAEAALRESLEMKRSLFGPGHWRVANGVANLASVLVQMDRLDEAEALATEALEITRGEFGEKHDLIGVAMKHLGAVRERRGDLDGAERYFRRSVAAHREVHPAGHPRIAESELELGRLLTTRGRAAEALPLLESALEAFRAREGDEHPRAPEARRWLEEARRLGR